MNENIKRTCDLIIKNRDALAKEMIWEMDPNAYSIMAGFFTTGNGVDADPSKYQKCKDILKKNTGLFSELRGLAGALVVLKMTIQDDPESYLKGVSSVYEKLRSIHKFTASAHMVMAAMNIYEHNGGNLSNDDIERFENLFKELKEQHPMLVGDADRGYLSMLATSGIDIENIPSQIEDAYEACKDLSLDKAAIQSLAQVLALSNKNAKEKYEFVDSIIKGLEKNRTPIGRDRGLSVLGALALLDVPTDQLINDITDASNYLKGKNGFKWYNEGRRLRTVYAALAVFLTYAKENKSIASSISSNIAMNIAEELLMVIVVIVAISSITASVASH